MPSKQQSVREVFDGVEEGVNAFDVGGESEGVADGSLRRVADPGAVAMSVFGAITVAGLSAAVEGSSTDPSVDAARFSAAICELILDGLATPRTRDTSHSR